jgi:hypothetical protein
VQAHDNEFDRAIEQDQQPEYFAVFGISHAQRYRADFTSKQRRSESNTLIGHHHFLVASFPKIIYTKKDGTRPC